VPLAAWSAIFVCDVLFGREVSEDDLFNPFGKYRGINWQSIGVMALATFIGYGFVTNTFASWLNWQGYFMDLIGGKDGQWGYSNVGVIFALIIGFIGRLALRSRNA
jgi:uncharacterized membrane protein